MLKMKMCKDYLVCATSKSWFSVVVNLPLALTEAPPQVYGLNSVYTDYNTLFMLVRVYKACVFKMKVTNVTIVQ